MIFGMTLATYTFLHVLISLVGIGAGLIVMFGLLNGKRFDGWTVLFLVTTVLTSVTGFGFPFDHLLPSHKVGILSLVILAAAIPARYVFHLAGSWRWVYVVAAVISLYLNVFVAVVQAFEKVVGQEGVLRHSPLHGGRESVNVVNPLADERTLVEQILVKIRDDTRVRIETRITSVQLHEA